jgi:hypothetical protein
MLPALKPHPQSPSDNVAGIEVDVSRVAPAKLALRYVVTGRIGDLCLPPCALQARRDDLWQHTCFEAFLRLPSGQPYHELNFSPSTEWAAYRFSGYRKRIGLPGLDAPAVKRHTKKDRFELLAELDLAPVPELAAAPVWQLGLSAVIEERNGHKSYWALAHPAGEPDFHHSDCFAIELAAAERS